MTKKKPTKTKKPAPKPTQKTVRVAGGDEFKQAWEQLESLRMVTEMTGGLHPAQQQHLKLWPRLAVITSVRSTATWDPGDAGKQKDQRAAQPEAPARVSSVDEIRCHHEVWDETQKKMVRMYRSVCTQCRPELAWPGRLGGAKGKSVTFDIEVAPRRREPEGLDLRLRVLGRSVQHMLGRDVRVVVNVGGRQTYVEEPKK